MKIESTRDILHWTVQLHENLALCLKHCALNHSERTKMAVEYLSSHEQHLATLTRAYSDKAQVGELETLFIEYIDNNPIGSYKHCEGDFDNMNESEIVSYILDKHQQVIALYTYLKEQAVIPHHVELFNELLELERQELVQMTHGLNRFQDM